MKKNIIWAVIFTAVCAVCIVLWNHAVNKSSEDMYAEIMQDGRVIRTVDLDNVDAPYEFEVKDGHGGSNTVRVERGRIAVTEANCPDKVCVDQGFTASSAVPIVCLPHKLSIIVKDNENEEYDAVVGGN